MPFDGNGTFVRTNGVYTGASVWASDQTAGVNILAKRHDTHDHDIGQALSMCLLKDGTQVPTGNLPMAAFKHTVCGATQNTLTYCRASDQISGALNYSTSTPPDEEEDLTVSLPISPTSYTAGLSVLVAGDDNTTSAVTLNVESLGAIDVLKYDGTVNLEPGDLKKSALRQYIFDPTTSNKFILMRKNRRTNTNELGTDAVDETKIGDLSDNIVFDTAGKGIKLDATTGISAAGTTQGGATALTSLINEVTGVNASARGVRLPAVSAFIGMTITVINEDSDELDVYPATGEGFAGESVNAAIQLQNSVEGNGPVRFIGLKTGSGNNWGYIQGL